MKLQRVIEYLDRRLGRHAGNGAELLFYCPACLDRVGSDSDKRKFAVNIDRQRGQCFRCEYKFRTLESLVRYLNGGFITPQEQIMLRNEPPMVGDSVKQTVAEIFKAQRADAKPLRTHRLPFAAKPITRENMGQMPWKRAMAYVESRGFTIDDVLRFDLRYCASGDYRNYLIFPVYQGGECVYWTSRYCGDHQIKSRNPPKGADRYGREHCLLNYDAVVGEPVVALVEGPFDCMAPEAAIALMGKEMGPFQYALVGALVPHGLTELVIMLDPGTGAKIDQIYAATLDLVPRVRVCYIDRGDPADRRADLPLLMSQRREPTLRDRIQSRLS